MKTIELNELEADVLTTCLNTALEDSARAYLHNPARSILNKLNNDNSKEK